MNCRYCGSDNRDDAVSCEICDMPLNVRERKAPSASTLTTQSQKVKQDTQSIDSEQLLYATCPHCGKPLHNCTPVSKTTITDSGGGYGFFSGCCGTILLGPLGLLCGLRKRSVTSSSQIWWLCKNCGKEFVEKETAKEVVNTSITGAAKATLIVALIWQFIFALIGYNRWVRDIALLIIAGIWIALPEGIREATGYGIKQLLTSEERKGFYKRCVLYAIGSFFAGAAVGGKVMQFFLS